MRYSQELKDKITKMWAMEPDATYKSIADRFACHPRSVRYICRNTKKAKNDVGTEEPIEKGNSFKEARDKRMRRAFMDGDVTLKDLANRFNVSISTVDAICGDLKRISQFQTRPKKKGEDANASGQ